MENSNMRKLGVGVSFVVVAVLSGCASDPPEATGNGTSAITTAGDLAAGEDPTLVTEPEPEPAPAPTIDEVDDVTYDAETDTMLAGSHKCKEWTCKVIIQDNGSKTCTNVGTYTNKVTGNPIQHTDQAACTRGLKSCDKSKCSCAYSGKCTRT